MWYCAHAIFYFSHEGQETFLVHENVYLIDAPDERQALKRAREIAAEHEDPNEDGHLEVNGRKAKYHFAGIRKLIEVEMDPRTACGELHSGVEASYSIFEVDSLSEVESLAAGTMTPVLYRE